MKGEKDFLNFDYQTIILKKEKADEVIESYSCFGWKVTEKTQHKQYENLIEVEFSRPHFIANKDELQFLQVNMECDINAHGKLERNKNSKTTSIAVCFGLLFSYLLTSGFLCFFNPYLSQPILLGIIFILLSLAIAIPVPFWGIKLHKKETTKFNEQEKLYKEKIANYCKQAKKLIGGKDEK